MGTNRQKVLTVSVSIIVVFSVVAGYFYWKNKQVSVPEVQSTADVANQGVLPSIGEAADPLANKPDISPTSKTNPFDSVKTNPFD